MPPRRRLQPFGQLLGRGRLTAQAGTDSRANRQRDQNKKSRQGQRVVPQSLPIKRDHDCTRIRGSAQAYTISAARFPITVSTAVKTVNAMITL